MTCGRIALFSAPCGFGKTVASRALLPGTEQCLRPADIKCLPGGEACFRAFFLLTTVFFQSIIVAGGIGRRPIEYMIH